MELAVVDPQAVRGCPQWILADLTAMSMPADETSALYASRELGGPSGRRHGRCIDL